MSSVRITCQIMLVALAVAVSGCAVRPRPPIPVGLTAEQAIDLLAMRQESIRDYSARARTSFVVDGVPQNVTLVVRYLAPGRCRVYVKGFGIDMARFSVLSDSVTVYVPPEQYFFSFPRTGNYVVSLAPGVDIGFETIEQLFTTTVPTGAALADWNVALADSTDNAVLILTRGSEVHRFVLSGADLLVIGEEYLVGGVTVWRKTISSHDMVDGIPFPSSVKVEYGTDSVSLSFSDIELNVGYNEESLRFPIPSSAERYIIGTTF